MKEWVLLIVLTTHDKPDQINQMAPVAVPGFTSERQCKSEGGKLVVELAKMQGEQLEGKEEWIQVSGSSSTRIKCVEIEK